MYETLVLFGATGDLSFRYLLPALGRLEAEELLPGGFRLLGLSREEQGTEDFRRDAREALERDGTADNGAIAKLVDRLLYAPADVTDESSLRASMSDVREPVIAYLALPPSIYGNAIEAVARAFPQGSRVVVEKPFGEGLDSARKLNAQLHEHFDEADVFRVDHFLGLPAMQAIPGLRFANRPLRETWNREHIEQVTIQWDEHVGLEGRARYYDGTGALRDMVQNHLLEVLASVAQEPPDPVAPDALRAAKCNLLRDIRPLNRDDVPRRVVRARYSEGEIDGNRVPAYVDEDGVDPARETETFVQLVLSIDNERWRGVPFVLRTGKALGKRRQAVDVRFRPAAGETWQGLADAEPPTLTIDLGEPRIEMGTTVTTSRALSSPEGIVLRGDIPPGLPAYARVLLDILEGDQALSVRDDEAEDLWRVVEPVLEAWREGEGSVCEYPAGSAGPSLDALEAER